MLAAVAVVIVARSILSGLRKLGGLGSFWYEQNSVRIGIEFRGQVQLVLLLLLEHMHIHHTFQSQCLFFLLQLFFFFTQFLLLQLPVLSILFFLQLPLALFLYLDEERNEMT